MHPNPFVRPVRLFRLVAAVAALALGAIAAVPPATAASAGKSVVKVKTFQFRPNEIEVDAGTKVTWKNRDEIVHTVTSTSGTAEFDGELRGRGASFSTRFQDPGTYEYACTRHPSMKGTVVVR